MLYIGGKKIILWKNFFTWGLAKFGRCPGRANLTQYFTGSVPISTGTPEAESMEPSVLLSEAIWKPIESWSNHFKSYFCELMAWESKVPRRSPIQLLAEPNLNSIDLEVVWKHIWSILSNIMDISEVIWKQSCVRASNRSQDDRCLSFH